MDHRGWGQDGLQRTRVTVGERVCGVLQCPAEGRTAGWGDLLHTPGGQRCDRKLATPLQHRPPAWVSGLQASGSGGVCARLHGLAGCAIPTGFAGQAPRSTPTNHALTFTSDHPITINERECEVAGQVSVRIDARQVNHVAGEERQSAYVLDDEVLEVMDDIAAHAKPAFPNPLVSERVAPFSTPQVICAHAPEEGVTAIQAEKVVRPLVAVEDVCPIRAHKYVVVRAAFEVLDADEGVACRVSACGKAGL